MKVSTQFFLIIILSITALVGSSLVGQYQMHKVFNAANYVTTNSVPSVVALDHILDEVASIRTSTWLYTSQTDKSKLDNLDNKIAIAKEKIIKEFNHYDGSLVADEQDRQFLKADRDLMEYYEGLRTQVVELVREGNGSKALEFLLANQDNIARLRKALQQHRDYVIDLAKKSSENALVIKQSAAWASFISSCLIIALISVLGWATFRNIFSLLGCEPREAAEIARKLSAG
ncbi:MAG: MCP four helix bundle domain-containing protein, partial [Desulfuromonadaceae bacterium]